MKELILKDYSLLREYVYHQPLQIYLGYFQKIPSKNTYSNLKMKKLIKEFPKKFKGDILKHHYEADKTNKRAVGNHFFILKNEILVEIDSSNLSIYFLEETQLFLSIVQFGLRFKRKKSKKAEINLIITKHGSFENRKVKFKRLDLKLNEVYNDDFIAFHQKVITILNEKNRSGLHLLYGIPGTGKSTYIRYLCGILKKKVIFLPGQLAQNLDNVYMTRFLISNSNSILVIEDAEELIVSRDHQRNSNLAMILNMTDGIIGESLGIQIIATFNTDLKNIDPALKRKGRLKSSYEFKPLEAEKANHLLKEERIEEQTSSPLTLAEIYNFKEEQQMKDLGRKVVGFR